MKSGHDYGLKHKRWGYAFEKRWLVAVQSEKELGQSCPGENNLSFVPNEPGSPVTLNFHEGANGYTVNLKTDLYANEHPCGAGHFTWATFQDHIDHGGGPLPRPDKLVTTVTAYYQHWLPAGAARGIIGFQGFWNGRSHLVEVSTPSDNWGDNYPASWVIDYKDTPDLEFVNVDARGWGIGLKLGVETTVEIDWVTLLDPLIFLEYLDPVTSWDNATTQSVFMGHELKNEKAKGSGVADLWFSDFKVEDSGLRPSGNTLPQ